MEAFKVAIMKVMKAEIIGLFIIVAANAGTASAMSLDQEMNQCLVGVVNLLDREQTASSGRNIKQFCGCFVNKERQGLSPRECPRLNVVTESQLREKFEGNW